jgi:uncharacterized protein (TIGR02217 family)
MFLEKQFPCNIAMGSMAGPERKTEIVTLGSGFEERNSRWANSRRVYNAGYGIKGLNDLHSIVEFFEETRGRLYGFRWKDFIDFKSCAPQDSTTATNQTISIADGVTVNYQLIKKYGTGSTPWYRDIKKPVTGTVKIAVDGVVKSIGTQFTVSTVTGIITFLVGHIPTNGQIITSGYEFDVPVRFDTDRLEINVSSFQSGDIPNIPVIELRI